MQRGFLVTRGLGCGKVLVTRGLGSCVRIVVTLDVGERPRQLRIRGGSGRRDNIRTPDIECVFIKASLVTVNNVELDKAITGDIRVDCRRGDTFKIRAALPTVQRRRRKIVIFARLIRDPDF